MVVFGSKSSSAKTKLFEQPLDKLFSPKAIKQLNEAISASSARTPLSSTLSAPLTSSTLTWAKLSQDNSATKRRRTLARLRRFTIDANNNNHTASLISSISSPPPITDPHYTISAVPFTVPTQANNYKASTSAAGPSSGVQTSPTSAQLQPQTTPGSTSGRGQHQQENDRRDCPAACADESNEDERARLLINVLPEPIRCLLNELYLRGPETVGIFRKSPNAKHCKELRQKLESLAASEGQQQSSIEQFQVTVIASVFKEWLRSLPDCLLMSRLYPQWIDVAKLIEPLHLDKQRQQQQEQTSGNIDLKAAQEARAASSPSITSSPSPQSLIFKQTDISDNLPANASLASFDGPSVGKGNNGSRSQPDRELSRALSCSTMTTTSDSGHSSTSSSSSSCSPPPPPPQSDTINNNNQPASVGVYKRQCQFKGAIGRQRLASEDLARDQHELDQSLICQKRPEMTAFELRERHTECIRIVRQLLDLLNEANLILLRAIICVLWHIADNCEHNKMSSQNLGVCIGQSLLNDEHQMKKGQSSTSNLYSMRSTSNLSSTGSSTTTASAAASALKHLSSSTFAKRHRRARSQCLLASTLSLTNLSHLSSSPSNGNTGNNSMTSQCYLDSSSAQEAAKYVPILVAFMIDNAEPLFGPDIVNLFGKSTSKQSAKQAVMQQYHDDEASNRSFAHERGSLASQQATAALTCETAFDGAVVNEPNDAMGSRSVVKVGKSAEEEAEGQQRRRRAPSATERLCCNQSDLVFRSGVADSIVASATRPGPLRGNALSTSVIVRIGEMDRASSGDLSTQQDRLDAVAADKRRASSPSAQRLTEAGTTTSVLILNAPKTAARLLTTQADHQTGNQSTSSCGSGSSGGSAGCAISVDEVDSCNRRKLQEDSQPVSPSCGSNGGCSNDGSHRQQQRPLSATESTASSSRASSSTSGVHSESLALSSETDTRKQRDYGQTATSSSASSMSTSSPDPTSSTPSICTSPVDMVDGQINGKPSGGGKQSVDFETMVGDDRGRHSRYTIGERPKSMASLNDSELLEFRAGVNGGLNRNDERLLNSRNQRVDQHQHNPSQDYANFVSHQKPQQKQPGVDYTGHRGQSIQSQTLNRYSSASSHHVPVDRMPKIPFQYTTSCYGGAAVLYYPPGAHVPRQQQQQQQQQLQQQQQQQQRQAHQDFPAQRSCTRIQSLDRQPWAQQQNQSAQKSHVMMLRDYYLSLQEQSKQRQQSLMGHQHQPRSAGPALNQPLHCQQHQQQHQRQRQQPTSQQSMLINRLHQQVPSPNELARLQYQQQQHSNSCSAQNLAYRQQPASAAVAYHRIQPRLAKIRPNQFNGLYVRRAPSPSHLVADVARLNAGDGGSGSGLIVCPLGKSDGGGGGGGAVGRGGVNMMAVSQSSLSQQSSKMSSTSSTENSADDESDDCSTCEWMESTMV